MKKIFSRALFTLWVLIQTQSEVWARAGGAGGGHGGGGGFGGGGHYSGGGYGGGMYVVGGGARGGGDFFFSLLILIIIAIVVVAAQKKKNGSGDDDEMGSMDRDVFDAFPGISLPLGPEEGSSIKSKVRLAFLTIQKAWSEKNLTQMRRFISDGVYQRFNAQFTMMNILDQKNPMTEVDVLAMKPVSYIEETDYQCLIVAIKAVARDQFMSAKYPQFNSPGGKEIFVEFWTFIRRKDYKKGCDIFHSQNCPQCGAALTEKLLETAKCPYCGVYLNSGEFDWVLSEITQPEDYGADSQLRQSESQDITRELQKVMTLDPTFAIHVLEDRASNAFLQVLIAIATRQAERLKRFSTPQGFEKFKTIMSTTNYVYNRLYLAEVTLLKAEVIENSIKVYVGIDYAFQLVELRGESAHLESSDIQHDQCVMVLIHEVTGAQPKGNIFANTCSSCGAPQKDSLSPVCSYCGAHLNDPKHDWVADDRLTLEEFFKL